MKSKDAERHLPLSPRMFHILLALADGPQNGYQTGLRVEDNSGGRIELSPATLYENLHRLERWQLIGEVAGEDGKRNGRQQRFYDLTDEGREILSAELERLRLAVRVAAALPQLRS